MNKLKSGFILLVFLPITACQDSSSMSSIRESFVALAQEQKAINCTFLSMKDSISTKWDEMGRLLETHLPQGMPEEEKSNMVSVRNADLIRMFQSFKQLDDTVKMELSKLELEDSLMVTRFRHLNQLSEDIEQKRMSQFNLINQISRKNAQRWAMLYDSILQSQCVKITY